MKKSVSNSIKTFACGILAVFLMAMSCEDEMMDNRISLYNHSGEVLYIYENVAIDSIMPSDFDDDPTEKVQIDRATGFQYYDSNISDGKKFDLLIFKQSTVDQYGWETIRQQNIYDKRFFLDLDSLEQPESKLRYYGD